MKFEDFSRAFHVKQSSSDEKKMEIRVEVERWRKVDTNEEPQSIGKIAAW